MNLVKLMEFENGAKLLQNLLCSIHAKNTGSLQSTLESTVAFRVPLLFLLFYQGTLQGSTSL